jgi:hypothetical protein
MVLGRGILGTRLLADKEIDGESALSTICPLLLPASHTNYVQDITFGCGSHFVMSLRMKSQHTGISEWKEGESQGP